MKKRILLLVAALQVVLFSIAQSDEQADKNLIYKGHKPQPDDTTSLLHAFKNGELNGHLRYFLMSTQNEKDLTDYYANAIGAGIRFETARFHNFQFAISGFTVFNIGSSDLTKPDTLTGQYSRYETGLFDITNPGNKKDLNRLEEFYLKYNFKHSYIKAGRQYINTAFINLQDGRMNPTTVSGLWSEINEIKKLKLQLGWLWGISPRSTLGWYKPGRSIGINPVGTNPDGTKSGYATNLTSNGIGIIQATATLTKQVKIQVSNMYVENIFNTSLLQIDYSYLTKNKSSVFAGVQVVKQLAVNNGGNIDQSKTYFRKAGSSLSFGARVGWKNPQWETSLNFNRITKEGRYLVPREWGTEPFFTFLPRERNDGSGDVQAIMGRLTYAIPKARIKTSIAAGYYHLPDVKDFALNKYAVPSYTQVNADIKYTFTNTFNGLEVQLLIVGKLDSGETYNNNKFVFNKVNMVQYNLILNYHF